MPKKYLLLELGELKARVTLLSLSMIAVYQIDSSVKKLCTLSKLKTNRDQLRKYGPGKKATFQWPRF